MTKYQTADAETCEEAIPKLKRFAGEIRSCRKHGRYALSHDLDPRAHRVIDRALAYCEQLAEGIGPDTQLGCCGTPATWARNLESERRWIVE